jgi:hypothetical protein
MAEVRKPTAGQRIVKSRNARLALEALKKLGVNVDDAAANRGEAHERCQITPDSIISGHAREVLALLWAIASESFDRIVPFAQLRIEIALLERKLRMKGLSPAAKHTPLLPGNVGPVPDMLFRWARAVCGLYGVTVRSCATSFTDGSALCLLVHHYVPRLIDWAAIVIPAPVPRDVAEDILGVNGLPPMESLSWSDNLGLQNSSVQHELESYRRVPRARAQLCRFCCKGDGQRLRVVIEGILGVDGLPLMESLSLSDNLALCRTSRCSMSSRATGMLSVWLFSRDAL